MNLLGIEPAIFRLVAIVPQSTTLLRAPRFGGRKRINENKIQRRQEALIWAEINNAKEEDYHKIYPKFGPEAVLYVRDDITESRQQAYARSSERER
jgi:hypothetical protein